MSLLLPEVLLPPSATVSTQVRTRDSITVISGGTGCNPHAAIYPKLFDQVFFCLGVSDDGGSSAEIRRVLGGPSLGDLRSRLVRFIPTHTPANRAIKKFFEYRFSATADSSTVKMEWLNLLEGRHFLWEGIPLDRRETIKSFLVHFEYAILRRSQKRFSFKNASIGNLVLCGCQLFTRSLTAAIFLFAAMTGIPENVTCIPCINTNSLCTIAAELQDDSVIVGQSAISHPAVHPPRPVSSLSAIHSHGSYTPALFEGFILGDDDGLGYGNVSNGHILNDDPGSPTAENIVFTKDDSEQASALMELPAAIRRIYYINAYGQECFPAPNPTYIAALRDSKALVYSCGSLYTSIVPVLSLRGIADMIAKSATLKLKILMLNGRPDRENSHYSAMDFIDAVSFALNEAGLSEVNGPRHLPSEFITHILYLQQGTIKVDVGGIENLGIQCIEIPGATYEETNVEAALRGLLDATTP